MLDPIAITATASISPLGVGAAATWASYRNPYHCIREEDFGNFRALTASLSEKGQTMAKALRKEHSEYKNVDNSVVYAVLAARNAVAQAGWKKGDRFGVNIGSSRGATGLFEQYHKDFLRSSKAQTLTSPTTTLGNISSWVACDLQNNGPEISHSITCSTALHALLNGVAWLQSGLADKFLIGGSEASLTPFTIAQMQALRLYAKNEQPTETKNGINPLDVGYPDYPCQSLNLDKQQNTMVLGEGAGMACLEKGNPAHALAYIRGIGYATELPEHSVAISAEAACLQRSMTMALGDMDPAAVDAIVLHAPGTVKGDRAEYNAVKEVFGSTIPALTSNKWKTGHTFGASGILSVELAVLMLQHGEFIPIPYLPEQKIPSKIENVLVNAVGFGGNAVSVLLGR